MKVIYSDIQLKHAPRNEIFNGNKEPYAERPERILAILNSLQKLKISIIQPKKFPLSFVKNVHEKQYVDFLKKTSEKAGKNYLYPSVFPYNNFDSNNDFALRGLYAFDLYTPIGLYTYKSALMFAMTALTGAYLISKGEKLIYSLCRPPGHHAERSKMGGYCYFNNAAIAADYLSNNAKVAILDIDFHHGNGTQRIFYERKDVFYISIHADPTKIFPYFSGFSSETGIGEGKNYNKNFPLPLGTGEKVYEKTLELAMDIIKEFNPKFLIVSAGFDTYINDPIGGFKLTIPFYKIIGKKIKSLNIPTLVTQEGGYHVKDLGMLAICFLKGLTT